MKKTTKKIKRVVFTIILLIGLAFAAILMFGGEGLRWFGEKSEDVGEVIKETSEDLGEKADELKEGVEKKADNLKEGVSKKAGELKKDVKNTVSGD